jgi:hypothetical protein
VRIAVLSDIHCNLHRWAEYAVLDMAPGRASATLHRRPIDFEHLARLARASGLPDVEFWLGTW